MTTIEERRKAETAKYVQAYEHPKYDMKGWRQEIVREWLSNATGMGSPTYLDVGCGRGETLKIASEIGIVAEGCEIVPAMCERPDVTQIEGAHSLPFGLQQFDAVSCNDVLEHIIAEDIPDVLLELCRVTRHDLLLGISHKPGPLHISCFDREWWTAEVTEAAMCSEKTGTVSLVYDDRIPRIKQPYTWLRVVWS